MSQVQLLELDVTADPSVLLRIVSLCHKRGIAIASLEYDACSLSAAGSGGRPPGSALRLGLRCDAERAGLAARWLDAIVPVLAVRSEPAASGYRRAVASAQEGHERLAEPAHVGVPGQNLGAEL